MLATTHYNTRTQHTDRNRSHSHLADLKSASAIRADRELRHERWLAVGVLVLFIAMIAFLLTIAVIGGDALNMGTGGYEYWMMP